jgi:hypothetical protein
MTRNHISIQPASDAFAFAGDPADLCQPAFMDRPVIRLPRSVTRSCSDSELQTAASMLNKLRCRDDQKMLAHAAVATDVSEHAVDVAVDRLMRVLA